MIRSFTFADLDSIMEIWLHTNIQSHSFIPRDYWTGNFDAVKSAISKAEVYVYENDNTKQIDGFIGLTENFVEGLFIKSSAQSKEIGKLLLDFVKGIKSELTLSVYRKNTRAVSFYMREGFLVKNEGTDDLTGEKELLMVWHKQSI